MTIQKIAVALIFSVASTLASVPSVATAAGVGYGLSVSPPRQTLDLAAGSTKTAFFTVKNATDKSMVVDLSVKEFSVSDKTYDYVFSKPEHEWVKTRLEQLTLQPNHAAKIIYDVTVPERAKPGGYYFALFASTKVNGAALPGTEQVATLLYVTVDGKLVRTSVLQNDSVPWFVMGDEIPYKFSVKDTGNVYFTAYFYGKVNGLFVDQPASGTSHIVMPGATRTISGSVPTPFLPGVYTMTYGYKVDFANIEIVKTTLVIFIPPWSIAASVFVLLLALWLRQRRYIKKEQS
ncbi:MAG: hypothetical protein H6797_00960 [Candidatus Nomurabacteria bacterium]|nr:MAG: hypothetical protein H6797_00960 [Candidatus Nomurabacteria bacterium]